MKGSFRKTWWLGNTLAMFLAYLCYTPVAHGVTGPHTRELTSGQLLAHCLALALVVLIVFYTQKRILRTYIAVPPGRIAIMATLFVVLFWIGYYQPYRPGPDTDSLMAYLVLGGGLWLQAHHWKDHFGLALLTTLSFPIGSFIGQITTFGIIVFLGLEPDPQQPMVHVLYWLTTGSAASLIGGWISGYTLHKLEIRKIESSKKSPSIPEEQTITVDE